MALLKSALAVVAAIIASAASAQQSPMPEDLAWKLLELGRVIDPPKTAALYAPMQETEPYQGVRIERDVKYGPADRHLLDVFMPEASSSVRPVLIFIHGGAFVGGNKRAPGSGCRHCMQTTSAGSWTGVPQCGQIGLLFSRWMYCCDTVGDGMSSSGYGACGRLAPHRKQIRSSGCTWIPQFGQVRMAISSSSGGKPFPATIPPMGVLRSSLPRRGTRAGKGSLGGSRSYEFLMSHGPQPG